MNVFPDAEINETNSIIFTASYFNNDLIEQINKKVALILRTKDNHHINTAITFAIKELIDNALKANLKRIFFKLHNINISNIDEYKSGMEKFPYYIREEYENLIPLLEENQLTIRIIIKDYKYDVFDMIIINNTLLTEEEKIRINEKIKYFKKLHKDPEKCFNLFDETEGAGMGLFMTLKLFEQFGIKYSSLSIGTDENNTYSRIRFSYKEIKPSSHHIFIKEIIKIIDSLPKFPEHVDILLKKIYRNELDKDQIINIFNKDPDLSNSLLKFVNSSNFVFNKKIDSMEKVVNKIEIEGLKYLLYSYGAIISMNLRFGLMNEIWAHSYSTANICKKIAKIKKFDKTGYSYFTAGLLHGIGKIILMSFDEEKTKRLETICEEKGLNISITEEIMMGLSYAKIGGKIAEAWSFPDNLIEAINFHNDPLSANKFIDLVYCVNLANYFAKVKDKKFISLQAVNLEVRKYLKINSEQVFNDLFEKVSV